jgi:hypothetical protein
MALVEDHDLVELLVDTLAGLVERDKGGLLHDVGQKAEGLGIVESGRCVETTSRVVPRSEDTASAPHLGDRDTLPLSARDTAHEGVADDGVGGVLDVEHGEEELEHFLAELLVGDAWNLALGVLG